MDDMKLMKELDFASFEEEFKLNPVPIGAGAKGGAGAKANGGGDATDAAAKKVLNIFIYFSYESKSRQKRSFSSQCFHFPASK